MTKLTVFNNVSLDGYFTDAQGDMRWAHAGGHDPEMDEFVMKNTGGGSTLVFGRKTYDLMAGFWPTPEAAQAMPVVAERMNSATKLVFSRTMKSAAWNNTTVCSDLLGEIRRRKIEDGPPMTILGSGSLITQLARENYIDQYQLLLIPLALGGGRSLFEGIPSHLRLRLVSTRRFKNGAVLLAYESLGGRR